MANLEAVEERLKEAEETIGKLAAVGEKIDRLEEEGERRKEENKALLDRVEELEHGRAMIETKLQENERMENEVAEIRKEVEKEKNKWGKSLEEMEGRLTKKLEELKEGGGQRRNTGGGERSDSGERAINGGGERAEGTRRSARKCILITDSNGREATADSIKRHIPERERDSYDITNVTAYTLEEAYYRAGRGEIQVEGALVVLDNLTNDVRGTRQRPAASPKELVDRVDMLRRRLRGAYAIVTCQIKPMRDVDVSRHNEMLSDYLRAQGGTGYGCETMVRKEFLRKDGYHILPQFDSVLDKVYACALMGADVPRPTPHSDFLVAKDWPVLGGSYNLEGRQAREWGLNRVHGWGW